jgi:hypothetical protein
MARHDPRGIVVDPHARFFGAAVDERSLLPSADARLGDTRFEVWLSRSVERAYNALRPPTLTDGAGGQQASY